MRLPLALGASLAVLSCFNGCTGTSVETGKASPAVPPAKADLGPLAPDATGKPLVFALEGIEIGMTFDEVKAAWGKPVPGTSEYALSYRNKGGYPKVELFGSGEPKLVTSRGHRLSTARSGKSRGSPS